MKSATISKAGHFEGNCPLRSTGPSDSRPVSEGFAAARGPASTLISPMIVTLPHSPGGAYQAQHSRLIPQEFFQANIPPGVIRGSPFQVCVPPGCSQAGQRVQFRCPCRACTSQGGGCWRSRVSCDRFGGEGFGCGFDVHVGCCNGYGSGIGLCEVLARGKGFGKTLKLWGYEYDLALSHGGGIKPFIY